MRQLQHAWQHSLWGRFLGIAVTIILVIGITSISTTTPVAHANAGSSSCSFTTPCTFAMSPCNTQDGSFCVSLAGQDPNRLTFQWSSSLSPGSLDHYNIQQTLLDANNPSNSVPPTTTEPAYDSQGNLITDWTWGPLQANQLYVFMIQGCDSSNYYCTNFSSPVAIDTGYFVSTTQTPQAGLVGKKITREYATALTLLSQNCSNQISLVSGAWPDVTYHLNDCLIQSLNNGVQTIADIAQSIASLTDCPECTAVLGILSALIQYELHQLASYSTNCNGTGADIHIQAFFVQAQQLC